MRVLIFLLIIPAVALSQSDYDQDPKYYEDTLILSNGEVFPCHINETWDDMLDIDKLCVDYITEDGQRGYREIPMNLIKEVKSDKLITWNEILNGPFVKKDEKYLTYRGVIDVDGVSKEELYSRGRMWFYETYKDSEKVLKITDKESGELAGTGIIPVSNRFKIVADQDTYFKAVDRAKVEHDIILEFKDNKCRFTFKSFDHDGYEGNDWGLIENVKKCPDYKEVVGSKKKSQEYWTRVRFDIEFYVAAMVLTLREHLYGNEEDDW